MDVFHSRFLPLQHKLYRFAYRIMGSQADAEDVVQEVYVRVWKKKDEWNEWKNAEAMCMTIVRNLCMDKKRSKYATTVQLPEHYDEKDTEATPEQMAVSNDGMKRIRKMMEQLGESQRMVIQLRDVEGYSYKEIGEMMNMSLNQVKINLHRARLRMRHMLTKAKQYGTA